MLNEYPDVMTVKQMSEALHISKGKAYELINQRVIGSRRIGRKILVPKICVTDYLNSARYLTKIQ